MRVALLHTKDTARSRHLLDAFAAGLRAHGDDPYPVGPADGLLPLAGADAAVQVCFPNVHHDGNPTAVFRLDAYRLLNGSGRRVVTIDTGFVKNQSEAELAGRLRVGDPATYAACDGSTYYSVGFDGIKNAGAYYNAGSPADRWEKLGRPLKPRSGAGRHVLLVGQPLHGLSSQHLDIYQWYGSVVAEVRRHTHRPVLFRPHPRLATLRTSKGKVVADRRRLEAVVRPAAPPLYSKNALLADDLRHAWAAVVLTSNAAVEAVVAGVPVFAADDACVARPVSCGPLAGLARPRPPDATQWARDLAYAQWNPEEMRSGECWAHLRPHARRMD